MFNAFELQTKLVLSAYPSGNEAPCAELLAKLAKPFVDEITTDALGNLICHKKGNGKKIMMSAHMDTIGFIVTCIDEHGYVWFDGIGGHAPALLINTRVEFKKQGVSGIIRLRNSADFDGKALSAVSMRDLYIDIGAQDQKEAQKHLSIGDVATFEGKPQHIGGGNVRTPYADDLISCVMLLLAMEQVKKSPNDLYFVFSTQEELGLRGAKAAAYGISPDLGIAVDVCPVGDTPGDDTAHMAVALGKGPTIKIKDSSVYTSEYARDVLKKAAKKANVKYQDEILTGGGTDTGAIQGTKAGVHAVCISVPTRNIHAPVEIFNISDVEQGAKMLACAISNEI